MGGQEPQFIRAGKSGCERDIAVLEEAGRGPAFLWLSGFKSVMTGSKAQALAAFGKKEVRAVIRFDYSGHGQSGGAFEDACVSDWLEEAEAVFDRFCPQGAVLVGSSMGGWIALLLALSRKASNRVKGLVLIAPAVDFTEELMWKQRFTDEIRETILRDGRWAQPSEYSDDPYVITRRLIEDGRQHLLFQKPLHLGIPVAILQGALDPDVPVEHAQRLVQHLPLDDVTLSLVPDGDHRLSRPEDIDLLTRSLASMISAVDI
ncbi:alpha/beta hydrolase [Roseibium denhamense]|uniref:Esterase/lipase n=1 Tax=Roseibium denhamense TaxID=76305 RepID=A0ABY1PAR7_9HYPH|nr:alpha/beta hydrolase [Roseibium denhamense]MTI07396.1 alpha/beta hydrolase [Roseibium denhamense]SMP29358.1 Esterase/lipase [Roseibium denhamense]